MFRPHRKFCFVLSVWNNLVPFLSFCLGLNFLLNTTNYFVSKEKFGVPTFAYAKTSLPGYEQSKDLENTKKISNTATKTKENFIVHGQREVSFRDSNFPPQKPSVPYVLEEGIDATSIKVFWNRNQDRGYMDRIDAFQLQMRNYSAHVTKGEDDQNNDNDQMWITIDDTLGDESSPAFGLSTTFNEKATDKGGEYLRRRDVQILSIRVDKGHQITSGYFQLAYNFGGYMETLDPEDKTITAPIPFNASAIELKHALEGISTIQNVEVVRCDHAQGYGSYDNWFSSCPFADRGGYEWHILFDPIEEFQYTYRSGDGQRYPRYIDGVNEDRHPIVRDKDVTKDNDEPSWDQRTRELIPRTIDQINRLSLLHLYKEELGGKWTGGGNKINIERAGNGILHSSLCPSAKHASCSVKVLDLIPGTAYSFRILSRNSDGWSTPSIPTAPVYTKPKPSASRLPAPLFGSSTNSEITLLVDNRIPQGAGSQGTGMTAPFQRISIYEVEYRKVGENKGTWDGKYIERYPRIIDGGSKTAITVPLPVMNDSIVPSTWEFRVRGKNSVKWGPWSAVSGPIKTDPHSSSTPKECSIISLDVVNTYADTIAIRWDRAPSSSSYSEKDDSSQDVVEIRFKPTSPKNPTFGEDWVYQTFDSFPLAEVVVDLNDGKSKILSSLYNVTGLYPATEYRIEVRCRPLYPYSHSSYNGVGNYLSSSWENVPQVYVTTSSLSPSTESLNPYFNALESTDLMIQKLADPETFTEPAPISVEILEMAKTGSDFVSPDQIDDIEINITDNQAGLAARWYDPDYVNGTATGGTIDNDGNGGAVVVLAGKYSSANVLKTIFLYSHSQETQHYEVPKDISKGSWPGFITFKVWGAGGAGGAVKRDRNVEVEDQYLGVGGGGGYVQARVAASPGDMFTIIVGGGGRSPNNCKGKGGGTGGYNGGAKGGHGIYSGGGGGGATTILNQDEKIVLVAGGGGGAGSTNYCCSYGGGGGGSLGLNGSHPLYDPSKCEDESCINGWPENILQFLPEPLQIDFGFSPNASFLDLPEGGVGGGNIPPVYKSRSSSSYAYSNTGTRSISTITNMKNEGNVPLSHISGDGSSQLAGHGMKGRGGTGADGYAGGGGGGGGFIGGSGGGSGVNGASGGGGSSYINYNFIYFPDDLKNAEEPLPPSAIYAQKITHESIVLSWDQPFSSTRTGQEIVGYEIEGSDSQHGDDFVILAETLDEIDSDSFVYQIHIRGLLASSFYRFRVRSVSRKTKSTYSHVFSVQTMPLPQNEWKRVYPRRLMKSRRGRGINSPVLDSPHISPVSQVRTDGIGVDDFDYADPPTFTSAKAAGSLSSKMKKTTHTLPSPRRGGSMVEWQNRLILFGGSTAGYDCSRGIKDTSSMGENPAALPNRKCRLQQYESKDVWLFHLTTNTWEEVTPVPNSGMTSEDLLPPPRELHSASMVNGKMYVFGGTSRKAFINSNDFGTGGLGDRIFYDDIWVLNLGAPVWYNVSGFGGDIPEGNSTYLPVSVDYNENNNNVINENAEMCVVDLEVTLSVTHPCTRQVEIYLYGPGPNTYDATLHQHGHDHRVKLFSGRDGTQHGCGENLETTSFNDSSLSWSLYECCKSPWTGKFMPEEPLGSFKGVEASGEWKLRIHDNVADGRSGTIDSWNIAFQLEPCRPKYTWTNLTSSVITNSLNGNNNDAENAYPKGRFQHSSIVVSNSIFILGGYDESRKSDLWRFDVDKLMFTRLYTNSLQKPLTVIGRSGALTPFGLIAFGGMYMNSEKYTFLNSPSNGGQNIHGNKPYYTNTVQLQNVMSQRWTNLPVAGEVTATLPHYHRAEGSARGKLYPTLTENAPIGRYFAAATMAPQLYEIYENNGVSSMLNRGYNSIYVFGGYDGHKYMDELYELSLGGLQISSYMGGLYADVHEWRNASCGWRLKDDSTEYNEWLESCMSESNEEPERMCEIRDIMTMAWCKGNFQSVNNL